MLDKEIIRLKVTGDFACFTRPDLKVERMSYPCMTPSAARGVLEAILWKPEFQWYVRRIIVLKDIKFTSIKRNEIKKKQILGGNPICIDALTTTGKPENRVQRNSIVLKDVAYIIEASIFVDEDIIRKTKDSKHPATVKKYRTMFERRVSKGQCWHQPYLGTREFAANFSMPTEEDTPLPITYPIGSMLYDIYYDKKGKVTPVFFYDAVIDNGILRCPEDQATKMLTSYHHCPKQEEDYNRSVYNYYLIEQEGL